jgi:hypothetical protein
MLLAWSEYKNNRITGAPIFDPTEFMLNENLAFRSYYSTVTKMAMDLGIDQEAMVQMVANERERNRRRLTWQGVLQLHMAVSSSECEILLQLALSFMCWMKFVDKTL